MTSTSQLVPGETYQPTDHHYGHGGLTFERRRGLWLYFRCNGCGDSVFYLRNSGQEVTS